MPLIVIDGPSGVGKSLLANSLRDLVPGTYIRHWYEIAELRHSSAFEQLWKEDISAINDGRIVVWVGSWAQTAIQSELRSPFTPNDAAAFLGEWYYGRLAAMSGLKLMLLASSEKLSEHRTDSEIHPKLERAIYENYALRWNWKTLVNDYSLSGRVEQLLQIVSSMSRVPFDVDPVPGYCGPLDARAVFVSSAGKDELTKGNGTWLPFSGKYGTKLGQFLGTRSVRFGYAHSRKIPPVALRSAKVLIASDRDAESWCYDYVNCRDLRIIPALRTLFGGAQRENHENMITDLLVDLETMERSQ